MAWAVPKWTDAAVCRPMPEWGPGQTATPPADSAGVVVLRCAACTAKVLQFRRGGG